MRLHAFMLACSVVLAVSEAETKRGFLLSLPKILQSGAREQVCLKLHNVVSDTDVTITVTAGEVTESYYFTFYNGEGRCVHLDLPTIAQDKAEISVEGNTATSDYVFNGTQKVDIKQNTFLTFIQTDKPIYKPGQTVKFRILSMTPDLKPLLSSITKVWIEDPVGSRIVQWLDVENEVGLTSLDLKLSSEPVQGEWKISAIIQGKTEKQTFEVKEYVLPKFSVTITPPTHLPVDAEFIDFEVCAKYTYGEPVSGDLVIALCVSQHDSYWYKPKALRPCSLIFEQGIKGCKKYHIPSSEIGLNNPDYHLAYSAKLKISATVTEENTELRQNTTDESCEFVRERLSIDMSNSPSGFKPGLNFNGKAVVTTPGGEPAPNERIEVRVQNYKSGEVFEQIYTTDDNGEFLYSVPSFKQILDANYNIHAKAIEYSYNYTDSDFPYALRMYTPTGHHYVKQWFSPSGSFLQVEPVHQALECEQEVEIEVAYTTEANTNFMFHYEVMSRGNIVHSGHKYHHFKEHDFVQPHTGDEETSYETPEDEHEFGTPVVEEEIVPETASVLGSDTENRRPVVEEEIVPETASVLGRHKRDVIWPYFYIQETKSNITLPPHVSSLKIRFRVSPEMAPLSRLVVYYTRPDGEVVADATELNIQKCLANKVDLSLGGEARPGEDTTLRLKASPQSLCAVGVVDKSVHILRSSNQLTLARVFKQLEQYDINKNSGSRHFNDYCEKQLAKDPIVLPNIEPLEPLQPRPLPNIRPDPVPFDGETVAEEIEVEIDISDDEGNDGDDDEGDENTESEVDEDGDNADGGDNEDDEEEDRDTPVMRRKRSIWFPDQSNYYDALQAFDEEGLLVITDLTLQTRPCIRYQFLPYARGQPGVDRPMFMTVNAVAEDAELDGSALPKAAKAASSSSVNLRAYFPETWLWDLEIVGENGEIALPKKVPDTITEWVGSAFCTNEETGLGVSPVTKLRAFQPFFASFNLPYSVIRGEKVPVLVSVFNYLDECMAINLKLKKSPDGGYERLDKVTNVNLCVCGQETVTHKFRIIPRKLGNINITVFARSINDASVCGIRPLGRNSGMTDAVVRPLLVEPEGLPQEYTYSSFFCPQKDGESEAVFKEIDLPLPPDVVKGSARGTVSMIGDIMGPALSNLDNLLRMPYGCGEQNMVGFAPNIFVMQYLTHTSQVNQVIESKAKEYMRSGYQRELTYKHPDGSYSAFGKSDKSGSTWLTAFVVKCFAQAKPFVFIDDEVVTASINWFKKHQLENGCFPSVGKVLSKYMQGGASDGSQATLTAYVLVAMLEAGVSKESRTVVDAFQCLDIQPLDENDAYTRALVAYAYTLYDPKHPGREIHMDKLADLAVSKDGLTHWHNPEVKKKQSNDWFRPYGQTNAASVEMSAYALLAYISDGGENALVKGLPIVRWLSTQRNAYGGFASTQDTVIALQALAKYASLAYEDGLDLHIELNSPSGLRESLAITDVNSLVQYSVPVPELPTIVNYRTEGTGCALLQANVKYNIEDTSQRNPAFKIKVKALRLPPTAGKCREIRLLDICTKYHGEDGASNMAVVEVNMVSGWIPVKKSLKDLMNDRSLGLKRYDVDPKSVQFYFDQLTGDLTCFGFEVEQNIEVEQAKPAIVRVYDYYEQDQLAVSKWGFKKVCGTKEELPVLTEVEYDAANARGEQARQPITFPILPRVDVDVADEDTDDTTDTDPAPLPLAVLGPEESSARAEGDASPDAAPRIGDIYREAAACPACLKDVPFDELLTQVCEAKHVYKLRRRASDDYPIKVMADLRPHTKAWIGKFARYAFTYPCTCATLTEASTGDKLLAITNSDDLLSEVIDSPKTIRLQLKPDTKIVPLDSDIERKLRRSIKSGACK